MKESNLSISPELNESSLAYNNKQQKRKQAYRRQVGCSKVLLILLALIIVVSIVVVIVTIKTTPTTFELGMYDNTDLFLTVDSYDSLVFYVTPTTINKDDIELVVENPEIADCIIDNVYSVSNKRQIKIKCHGLTVGETTFYIKDKSSDTTSEIIHITIQEKETPPVDNSRTVYINHTGEKYHYNKQCAGSTAFESTLNQAKKSGKEPCSKCVD